MRCGDEIEDPAKAADFSALGASMSMRPNPGGDRRPSSKVDPEPLTVLLPVLGTLAGILATVARSQWNAPARVRSRIIRASGRLRDHLRRLQADLEIVQDVVQEAGAASFPFEIGNQLLLTADQYGRYREATANVMTHATRCVKGIHDIESSIGPELFGPDVIHRPLALATETQARLNGLLRNRDMTVSDAIGVLGRAIDDTQDLLSTLESQLRG